MRSPTPVVSLIAMFLAGCALAPPPPHTELVSQALPATTKIPPSWQAAADSGQVANGWLKSLNDPVLEAIVTEALANNLDLRQAVERVQAAQQTAVKVGAQLQPQVGVTLGARALHDESHSGVSDATAAYAGIAWEIDIWGKLRAQRAAAEAAYEATALDYAYARQSLAAMVARNWYLAIETRQLLAVAEQSVTI